MKKIIFFFGIFLPLRIFAFCDEYVDNVFKEAPKELVNFIDTKIGLEFFTNPDKTRNKYRLTSHYCDIGSHNKIAYHKYWTCVENLKDFIAPYKYGGIFTYNGVYSLTTSGDQVNIKIVLDGQYNESDMRKAVEKIFPDYDYHNSNNNYRKYNDIYFGVDIFIYDYQNYPKLKNFMIEFEIRNAYEHAQDCIEWGRKTIEREKKGKQLNLYKY